jgi:hypothetical protein
MFGENVGDVNIFFYTNDDFFIVSWATSNLKTVFYKYNDHIIIKFKKTPVI